MTYIIRISNVFYTKLFARNSGKGTGSGGGPSLGGEKSFLPLTNAQRLYYMVPMVKQTAFMWSVFKRLATSEP